MKLIIQKGETVVLQETRTLEYLSVEEGGVLEPREGKLLTLTVDGVHRDLAPGVYEGNVVLSVTEPVVFSIENHGQMEHFRMNAAVSVRDGKYVPEESVEAAQTAGSAADGKAENLVLRSEGDYFGGIYVDGTGSYEIDGADIVMNGHGGSDAVGYGASISVRGEGDVTIHNAKIHNVGSIRTALQVCGHGTDGLQE